MDQNKSCLKQNIKSHPNRWVTTKKKGHAVVAVWFFLILLELFFPKCGQSNKSGNFLEINRLFAKINVKTETSHQS